MGLSIQVRGAFELRRVAKRIRDAGRRDLDRQLRRGLDNAVKPLTAVVVAELPDYLPNRYAAVLAADLELRSKTRTGAGAAIRIVGQAPTRWDERDVAAVEKGILRHPKFGDRDWWYAQRVRAGFFSEPIERGAPLVREELRRVIADFLNKLAKG